jgi:hypothetical protein
MQITIKDYPRKGMALLTSSIITAELFEAVRDMPGRKRWEDRDLVFETSRANVEYLNKRFPEALWQIDRGEMIDRLIKLEADAREAKLKPLAPESYHFDYKTVPRTHQQRVFAISKDRDFYGVFLEQGLGKTKIDLDVSAHMWAQGKINGLLIDAPNGVHRQWVLEQIPLHLPDWVKYKAFIYKSEQNKTWLKEAEEFFAYDEGLKILAIHHDAFATDKGVAFATRFLSGNRVKWTIDESSRKIKTPGAKRTKTTLKLRNLAPYRRVMDGTPITKGVEDLYTQLKFLHDDVHGFNSFYSYRNQYCVVRQVPGAPSGVMQIVGYRNLEELQTRMDGWSVRMRSADCLDLPERIYSQRYVELTNEQKRFYRDLKNEFIAQLDSGEVVSVEQAVTKLLRLQQLICGHIRLDDGRVVSVDTNRHREALAAAEQIGDKVILWARFHHDIDLLAATFRDWNPVVWDGRTSTEERADRKLRFIQDKNCGAFIANPGSAGIGTDGLQSCCRHMIYYSNTFKAAERWQSEARLYRDGQKGTVNVLDLVSPGTIDLHILNVLKQRKNIANVALDIRSWLQ